MIVGSRSDSSAEAAVADGFTVLGWAEAAERAQILFLLLPDEVQVAIYQSDIAPHLQAGDALVFAHGYNIFYGFIAPPPEYAIAERFSAYAEARGVHPVTLAVAWAGSHPAVTAPIVGARDVEQLEPSLAAAVFEMTPEMRAEISALTPPVPLATDRSEERGR